jgi:signal transduction histidine kinase
MSSRFLGDAVGIIMLTPQLVAIRNGDLLRTPQRFVLLQTFAMVLGGLMLTIYAFYFAAWPVRFFLFSYLLLATFRLPPAGTFVVVLAVCLTAMVFALRLSPGEQGLAMFSLEQRLVAIQLFSAGSVLTLLPVAIVLHQRDALVSEAAAARDDALQTAQSKSDFLAAMSHEIRTPLNGILGFTELLQETDLLPAQRRQLQLIKEAGHSLIVIINDVLDLARAERGERILRTAPLNIRSLLESVRSLVHKDATARGLMILVDLPDAIPIWVNGDASRLRQVLLNLMNNAVKFGEGETVTVRMRRTGGALQCLHVEVADCGPGMTEDEIACLFGAFVRLNNSATRNAQGTGLGLSISKRLIEAMPGGRIGVRSVVGAGSVFWFDVELPECEGPIEMAESKEGASPQIPALRILVAEDYLVSQMIIEAMLVRLGHTVKVVENGQQAVEAIRRLRFDLVLMDMAMPVMSGLQATHVIRAMSGIESTTPIIALTANAMPMEIEACLAAGLNGHLSKPIEPAALHRQLALWGSWVEPE